MSLVIACLVVFGVLILWFMYTYNIFASKQQRIDDWWDEVDIHLKLRHELVPNILGKASSLMGGETRTLDRIAELSERSLDDAHESDFEFLENGLSIALHDLTTAFKNNRDLMMDSDFLRLMGELVSLEGRASTACKEHNMLVSDFNVAIKRFPANLVVGLLHFKPREMRIFVGPDGSSA
ncbi:MAG: LemA family protein [Synergistaceae bacterium]|jgi:LemA protein|nr:LemA family protein [Synergistaceae bacterium]